LEYYANCPALTAKAGTVRPSEVPSLARDVGGTPLLLDSYMTHLSRFSIFLRTTHYFPTH